MEGENMAPGFWARWDIVDSGYGLSSGGVFFFLR